MYMYEINVGFLSTSKNLLSIKSFIKYTFRTIQEYITLIQVKII